MRTCKSCTCEYETDMSTAIGAKKYFCSHECYTGWIDSIAYDPTIARTVEEERLLGIRKCDQAFDWKMCGAIPASQISNSNSRSEETSGRS